MANINSKAPSDLGSIELGLIKRLDKQNQDKIVKMNRLRRKNNMTGLGILGTMLGIYGYSMWAVKQESIVSDMDAEFLQQKK